MPSRRRTGCSWRGGTRSRAATISVLTNFWDWSGGLGQYRAWLGAGRLPDPAVDGWDVFQRYVSAFYRESGPRQQFAEHVAHLVHRFHDAPAIGIWEIANEPRGVGDPAGMQQWLVDLARQIRSIDAARPIATGTEGSTPFAGAVGLDFESDHAPAEIGVTTCHVWPENWRIYDPHTDEAGFERALAWAVTYVRAHAEAASRLGKPLWVEELGLARDGRVLSADAPTTRRDRFLSTVVDELVRCRDRGLPVAGILPWAWSGEALQRGLAPDADWAGDPPHEPPRLVRHRQ